MKLTNFLSENGITAAQIAAKIGVTEKAVSHWINGVRTPRPEQMVKIIEETRGAVTANDFLPAPQSDEAA